MDERRNATEPILCKLEGTVESIQLSPREFMLQGIFDISEMCRQPDDLVPFSGSLIQNVTEPRPTEPLPLRPRVDLDMERQPNPGSITVFRNPLEGGRRRDQEMHINV